VPAQSTPSPQAPPSVLRLDQLSLDSFLGVVYPRAIIPRVAWPAASRARSATVSPPWKPPAYPLPRAELTEDDLWPLVEMATKLQEAAQSELEKLKVQLAPLAQDADEVEGSIPTPVVAGVATMMSAMNVLATKVDEEGATTSAEESSEDDDDACEVSDQYSGLFGVGARGGFRSNGDAYAPSSSSPFGPIDTDFLGQADKPRPCSATTRPSLPKGFDLPTAVKAADMCGYAYYSADPKDPKTGETLYGDRLRSSLRNSGLRLIREVTSDRLDTYAIVSRSDDEVFVAFRGSCTLKNAAVDMQYQPLDEERMNKYAEEAGLGPLPSGVQVHAGFLEAWRSLRTEVLETIESEIAQEKARHGPARALRLVVTGHSMGGAIAMLASLELSARIKTMEWHPFRNGHVTYTFAAPRLGNAKFARLFDLAFPRAGEHWAVQRSNDAVPHLPFAAWGFRHPSSVAYIDPPSIDEETAPPAAHAHDHGEAPSRGPEARPKAVIATGDRGDDILKLKPFANKMHNWANYHHILAYLEPLQEMLTEDGERMLPG
jgi:hypothetical protein